MEDLKLLLLRIGICKDSAEYALKEEDIILAFDWISKLEKDVTEARSMAADLIVAKQRKMLGLPSLEEQAITSTVKGAIQRLRMASPRIRHPGTWMEYGQGYNDAFNAPPNGSIPRSRASQAYHNGFRKGQEDLPGRGRD